jgi:hypothetical protein
LIQRRNWRFERECALDPPKHLGLRNEKLSSARTPSGLEFPVHDRLADRLVRGIPETTSDLKWRQPHLVEERRVVFFTRAHSSGAGLTTWDLAARRSGEASGQKRALKDRVAASVE